MQRHPDIFFGSYYTPARLAACFRLIDSASLTAVAIPAIIAMQEIITDFIITISSKMDRQRHKEEPLT
ncbi:MAG TPA: hypothetical protein VHJ19_00895, partial [Gammaproteobacteria bacterium]|nr:hypothetical protein [Gammaproteobacteria bacterium]